MPCGARLDASPDGIPPRADGRIGELFKAAVRAGSLRAALWRAFYYGDDYPPQGAEGLPESLEFSELRLLKDAWLDISRQRDEAGLLEDYVVAGHPNDPTWLPDPGQTSLWLRLHELAMYSLKLGVNLIGAEGELECDGWTEQHRAFGAYVKKINGDWQSWYRCRG